MAVDLLENCSECYEYTLSQFPDTIVISADLDHAKEYYFKFTDKFNNSYSTNALTPDVDGIVTINVLTVGYTPTDFVTEPSPALFNKDAGLFTIEASETNNPWEAVDLTFGGEIYQCIVVEFFADDSDKNFIV